MSNSVLDASALLALLNVESGHEYVFQAITDGATMSTINLTEVVTKLSERGATEAEIRESIAALRLSVVDFDAALAYQTGMLRPLTRHAGLSLGDRACLALAHRHNLPVITAERDWAGLSHLGVTIRVIR